MEEDEIITNPYESFVSDPNVESDLDRSGIRTTTQTDEQLLANVPDAVGLRFDPTNFDYTKDLYNYYGGDGLPMIDTATDTNAVAPVTNAPITNVADTSSGTDSQITGSQDQAASGLNNVDTLDVPQINTAGQEFNVYTGEFDPNDEGTVFSDEALEDPAIANARLNSSFYVPNETNIPPEQPGILDNIPTAARDAFETVKSGASTALDFIKDYGYPAYQALQGNLVAAGTALASPLTLGLGFAGKVFESLGDTKSQEEYNLYSDEQKASIDAAYGPGGVMDGYNAVSGLGQGVQATVQSRLDQRRSSGIPDTSAASQELIGLQNNLGITDFTQLTQEQVSEMDDKEDDVGREVTLDGTGADAEENQPYNQNFVTQVSDPYEDIDSFYEGDDVGKAGAPGSVMDAAFGSGENLSSSPTSTTSFDDDPFQDTAPAQAPSQPDQRDRGGDGGGGGGGGKIVCTMMNDTYGFGNFRNKIWLRQSKDLAPEYQKGYHKIFLPLVRLSKTNVVIRKVLEHIAVHRTIDIRQEARGKVHILGRVYRKVLEPICYLVGKYVK